jgi:hypothetical protein
MDWSRLTHTINAASGTYTIVAPGITLWLTTATPLPELGPLVADVLERYLAFVPPDALDHYLAANGTYKKLTKKAVADTLKRLRSVTSRVEYLSFHFGQGPGGGVGEYGAHFLGSNLDHEDSTPLETNLLLLEFPVGQLEATPPDDFVRFAIAAADGLGDLNSGVGGYAFKHPQMMFRNEAMNAIARLALRHIGLDISYDSVQLDLKGFLDNVSWLTFFGQSLVDKLGGPDQLRQSLPAEMTVLPLRHGLLVRAGALPVVGDVNRGAKDVAPLRLLARLTKPVRVQTEYLGSDDELFAGRWLSRLD